MESKELLRGHYNSKYNLKAELEKGARKVKLIRLPRDRYEAAICWGRGAGRALEIGAGSGEVLAALSEYYEEYLATEFSVERVRYLERMFGGNKNIKIIYNDIDDKNINADPESFDTIIMISVIEHIIEPISIIRYCYSLLKPQGKILIQTPNIAKWTRRLKLLLGFFPSTGASEEGFRPYSGYPAELHDDGHLHYFTFRSLEKLLKDKVGFSKIKYCGYGKTFLSKIFPGLFSECFIIGIK